MECKKVRPCDRKELTEKEYEKRLIDSNILLPGEQYRYFDKWTDTKNKTWHFYGYFVTNYGRVITDNGQNKIKTFKEKRNTDTNNYIVVGFTPVEYNKGIPKTFRLHKLVATFFDVDEMMLSDNIKTPHIHHINNDKTNNRADNLLKIDEKTHEVLHQIQKAIGTDALDGVWQVAEKSLCFLKFKINGIVEEMRSVSLLSDPLRIAVEFASVTVYFDFNNEGFDIKYNKQ